MYCRLRSLPCARVPSMCPIHIFKLDKLVEATQLGRSGCKYFEKSKFLITGWVAGLVAISQFKVRLLVSCCFGEHGAWGGVLWICCQTFCPVPPVPFGSSRRSVYDERGSVIKEPLSAEQLFGRVGWQPLIKSLALRTLFGQPTVSPDHRFSWVRSNPKWNVWVKCVF